MVVNGVKAIVVAIHGILTRTTSPSWPDALDGYLVDCKVERRYYFAGPFPIFEHFLWNRMRASALAQEIALLHSTMPDVPIHFVAHSNGCDIAAYTIERLAKRQIHVETAILTAGVVDPQVKSSPFARMVATGWLQRAYAYCSRSDLALGLTGHLKWPYKDLGLSGWMDGDLPYVGAGLITRRFDGYDHSDYFAPENERTTFAEMRSDMGI